MSINLDINVSGISELQQRASALREGNRAQHGVNERLERVEGRSADLGLSGQEARKKIADEIASKAQKRAAEKQRQEDSWTDRRPIGHRHGGYPVAVAVIYNEDWYTFPGTNYSTPYIEFQPLNGSRLSIPLNKDQSFGAYPTISFEATHPTNGHPHITGTRTNDSIALVLPIDANTLLWVCYIYDHRIDALYRPIQKANGTYYLGGKEIDSYSTPEYVVSVVDDGWSFREPPSFNSYGGESYHCVVINKQKARAITMPTVLKEKLKDLVYVSNTGMTVGLFYEQSYILERYWIREYGGRYRTINGKVEEISPWSTFATNPYYTTNAIPNSRIDSRVYIGLHNVMSLGLATPFHAGNLTLNNFYSFGTPSVFAWLTNPVEQDEGYWSSNPYADIAKVKEDFGNNAPSIYLDGIDLAFPGYGQFSTNQDGSFTFDFPYTTQVVDRLEPIYPSRGSFKNSRANPKSKKVLSKGVLDDLDNFKYSDYQYQPCYPVVCAWDWGKPAYCRQQLYALGFTAADLSP